MVMLADTEKLVRSLLLPNKDGLLVTALAAEYRGATGTTLCPGSSDLFYIVS